MYLLPDLNELLPIKDGIFKECYFSKNFCELSFEKQLQILCDIVRQSVYPNGVPNPDTDIECMNGNCYTAAFCFLDYVKRLNIGYNHRCVLARKRKFDVEEVTSIHVLVLLDSSDGKTYQVDPTPFAGYKYGIVEELTKLRIYDEYVVIDDTIKEYLYIFRKIIYDNSINKLDVSKLDKYFKLCDVVEELPILKGYVALVLKILMKYVDNEYDQYQIQKRINNIKPCNKNNELLFSAIKEKLKSQTILWLDELRDLQASSSNIRRQLELAINCVQENKWLDTSFEKFINIDGVLIRASSINPRFFFENNYTLVSTNISNDYINKTISTLGKPLFDGDTNLFLPTEKTGIYPILYSPYYFYNSMQIIDKKIILYKNADFFHNYTMSFDSVFEILDNPVESSLNLLTLYPEHQVMTRFMYPNPRLIKSKKSKL